MPQLPNLTTDQYLQDLGTSCPVCHVDEADVGGFDRDQIVALGSEATQEVTCKACQSTWNDLYKLYGFHIETFGERALTADELKILHSEHEDGHPCLTKSCWHNAIVAGTTLAGYWDWVAGQLGAALANKTVEPAYRPMTEYSWTSSAEAGPSTCLVTVVSLLGRDDVDEVVGHMYNVRLPNGSIEQAFHDELSSPLA